MYKAVPDSNVLVSAFIVKIGVPNQIVRQSGALFILCSCKEILRESERILRSDRIRRKYRFTDDELLEYVEGLQNSGIVEMVSNLPEVTIMQEDPTDNVIIACAQKAAAPFIVTGDQHLLQLKMYGSIRIVTLREFLTLLSSQS